MNDPMSLLHSFFAMPLVEVVAALMGIISVWFARGNSILVYPTGIISVLLYIFICLDVGLYADSFINGYYLIVSMYGWYFWLHGGKEQAAEEYIQTEALDQQHSLLDSDLKEKAHITHNTFKQNLVYLFVTAIVYICLGFLLSSYTDSDVAWIDAFTTSVFLTAMYAMARKKIEHWIFWILGNAVSIPLYLYKELPVTALQYIVFLVLAIWGFAVWFKDLEKRYVSDN